MAPPSDAELRALRDPNDVLGLDDAALRRLLHVRTGLPAPPGAGHRELMRLALEEVSGRKIVVQSGGAAAGQSADFRTAPVERWSPAAVAAWAAQVGLPPDPFTEHGVDGPQLLAMTETQMGAQLGLAPWMVGTLKSQRAALTGRAGGPSATAAAPPRPVARPPQRKRALIIGINYVGSRNALNGCIMDSKYFHHTLRKNFGFRDEDILMLNEEQKNGFQIPTGQNIRMACDWLTGGLQNGDSLVFVYSGHGGQARARGGDEWDGMNETLLPLDFQRAGQIEDDELHARIIAPLPAGVKLHAWVDACHSGSILDLPYQISPEQRSSRAPGGLGPWLQASRVFKGTQGGQAFCFSGCEDGQTSADTAAMAGGGITTGAMCYAFLQSLESGRANTYGELLVNMESIIKGALGGGGGGGGGLAQLAPLGIAALIDPGVAMMMGGAMAMGGGLSFTSSVQTPQLSASHQFDPFQTPFQL